MTGWESEPNPLDVGFRHRLLDEAGVPGGGRARDLFGERLDERLDQAAEVVAAPGRVQVGEQREAPFVDRSHPVFEDRVHKTRLRAEVVLRGGVVALAGLGPDLPQRDRADPAFGEQPLGGEDHLLAGARPHGSTLRRLS